MPKARKKENRGLPARWIFEHGAYYYRVVPGQEDKWNGKQKFRLGKKLHEAHKAFAERIEGNIKHNTIGQLLDRYMLEVTPGKAPKSQNNDHSTVRRVRDKFGDMALEAIEPHHVYKYVEKRTAKVGARREVSLLSHAFSKAVEWGYIKRHPFKGQVRLKGEKPRKRYVEDWEFAEILALQPQRKDDRIRMLQAYLRLKLLTGLRRGDLLRLKIADCGEAGISLTISKTHREVGYSWTPELRAAVEEVKACRPVDISPFLICDRRGRGYMNEAKGTANTWDNTWRNFMKRVLAETKVTERFTEHDFRAKVSSDSPSLARAQQLLAHESPETTKATYRRKREIIEPTK